ncbi:MAG TPA: c-type cytochrome [Rhizomicrobium sp.]|nr:c-type cytochrome [Rhizomicrobium sp.]
MRNRITLLAAALCLSAAVGGAAMMDKSAFAQSATTTLSGVYTEAQATRGQEQYVTNCAPCHGATAQGNGEAPALTGAEFTADWIGLTLGDLFDRIRTTMPQDQPGKLSRDQYADVVAFILKINGYPAGQKDLDKRSEYLKAIGFVAPGKQSNAGKLVQYAQNMTPGTATDAAPARAMRARPPQFPPSDPAALDAAEKASGVLSPTANDPRNAPGTQPDPYVADEHFFKLPDGRHFGSTSSVAGDSKGHIWVAERCGANNCAGSPINPVVEFDAKGNAIKSFGAGQILFPHDLWIDSHDHLWIADGHVDAGAKKGNDVIEFDENGKILMTLGTPGASGNDSTTFNEPNAVLVTPQGTIFVADGHEAGPGHNARVMKFDKNGHFIKQWGEHGIGGGQFEVAHTLAMDREGHLYVGDRWNNRIQEFDQDGKLLQIFTQFGRPSGIFIDRNDIMYSTDSESRSPMGYGYHPGWKRGIHIGSVKDGIVTAFILDTDPNPDASATSGGEGIWADGHGVVVSAQVGQKNLVRYVKQ